jgi:hypothetical protein
MINITTGDVVFYFVVPYKAAEIKIRTFSNAFGETKRSIGGQESRFLVTKQKNSNIPQTDGF